MKRLTAIVLLAGLASAVTADEPIRRTLAEMMEVQVFPAAGQGADRELRDEIACYDWALSNVGADPFRLEAEVEKRKEHIAFVDGEESRKLRAEPFTAVELGTPTILNRGKARATQTARTTVADFRSAFAVCLESRNYIVRY